MAGSCTAAACRAGAWPQIQPPSAEHHARIKREGCMPRAAGRTTTTAGAASKLRCAISHVHTHIPSLRIIRTGTHALLLLLRSPSAGVLCAPCTISSMQAHAHARAPNCQLHNTHQTHAAAFLLLGLLLHSTYDRTLPPPSLPDSLQPPPLTLNKQPGAAASPPAPASRRRCSAADSPATWHPQPGVPTAGLPPVDRLTSASRRRSRRSPPPARDTAAAEGVTAAAKRVTAAAEGVT